MKNAISIALTIAIILTLCVLASCTGDTKTSVTTTTPPTTTTTTAEAILPTINPELEYCDHNRGDKFNDETMLYYDASSAVPIKLFNTTMYTSEWGDVTKDDYIFDRAVFYKNGKEVSSGYIEKGMTVKMYHYNYLGDGKLYGEYTVNNLVDDEKETVWLSGLMSYDGEYSYTPAAFVEKGTTIKEAVDYMKAIEDIGLVKPKECTVYEYTVSKNGKIISEGFLEEGMIVRQRLTEEFIKRNYDYDDPPIHDIEYIVVFV